MKGYLSLFLAAFMLAGCRGGTDQQNRQVERGLNKIDTYSGSCDVSPNIRQTELTNEVPVFLLHAGGEAYLIRNAKTGKIEATVPRGADHTNMKKLTSPCYYAKGHDAYCASFTIRYEMTENTEKAASNLADAHMAGSEKLDCELYLAKQARKNKN